MKLKSIFVAISLLLVLSACRKDSSEAEVSTVVGKWLIHSVKFSGTAYGNGQSIPMNNEQVVTDACVARSNFVFNENLSGTAETYELQSGSCTKADSKTFTYEYNSGTKQLKVVSDDKTEISTVSQLTNSRLAIVDNLNNQNLGEVNPELEGFYFTGTITTVLKK